MKVSNCCGAKSEVWRNGLIGYFDTLYAELCPKCGEHCKYIDETDLNTINTENETTRITTRDKSPEGTV